VFYLKEKKLVLPRLREAEAMDMVGNEKSRRELRFEKYDKFEERKNSNVGMTEGDEVGPIWQHRESERQRKYLMPSNRNFDQY
jgi:hypothetical protein